jgi:hypothetical protein
LEAKTSAVESGGARGAFYRVADDEARHRRRQPASGEWGLKDFHFEVEKEWGGESVRCHFSGGFEKGGLVLRFTCSHVREGGRRQATAQWDTGKVAMARATEGRG